MKIDMLLNVDSVKALPHNKVHTYNTFLPFIALVRVFQKREVNKLRKCFKLCHFLIFCLILIIDPCLNSFHWGLGRNDLNYLSLTVFKYLEGASCVWDEETKSFSTLFPHCLE